MGWSRPRLQICHRPEGLVELSAVEVWTKPMTDRGIYSYSNIVTDFGRPNDFLPQPRAEFNLPPTQGLS